MRVVAFNVKRCAAGHDSVAAVLRDLDPDVVALQEVVRAQVRWFRHSLGLHALAGPVIWPIGYGNALLLRERPKWSRVALFRAVRGIERRGCAIAGISGVAVCSTHLSVHAAERAEQAEELALLLDVWPSVVVAADLNEQPGGPVTRLLGERFHDAFADAGTGDGFTFPATKPARRIDYVLATSDINTRSCHVAPDVASDHLAVVADLDVPSG